MHLSHQGTLWSVRLIALFGLVCLCLILGISTWFSFVQQREAEKAHLHLAAQSLAVNLEPFLQQESWDAEREEFFNFLDALFQRIEEKTPSQFIALYWPEEDVLLFSRKDHQEGEFALPPEVLTHLKEKKFVQRRVLFGAKKVYIYGRKLDVQVKDPLFFTGNAQAVSSVPYVLLGLDEDKVLESYAFFQSNTYFQVFFLLFTAFALWGLLLAYLHQRHKARRTTYLEEFQATLLDNLPDGLMLVGKEQKELIVQSVNPICSRLLSEKQEDFLGKSIYSLPESVTSQLLDAGKIRIANYWQGLSLADKYLEWRAVPVQGQKTIMLLFRDKTQQKSIEKKLASAEKLAAIGSLAAGVAHEVRNPLSALRGFAQYFAKKLQGREPDEMYAKTMVLEADRLNRVISDLLFLAKPHALCIEKVALSDLIDELEFLLQVDIAKVNIVLEKQLSSAHVWADRDALKQVLLNLLLNSLAAVEENAPACQRVIQVSSGDGVNVQWLEIRDFGQGMSSKTLEHACEPFYTTKNQGTGLGLALVERIVHEHEGHLFLASSEGKGTTIHLYFPSREE